MKLEIEDNIPETNKERSKLVEKTKINKRNFGIDLLRIISMIHVLILHLIMYTNNVKILSSSKKYKSVWGLEIFSNWSVNCFGLISGVVGYKKYKFSNLIYLWFQIFFYSFPISIICNIIDNNKFPKKEMINSLFPIMIIRHWYFNAYFIMYLFIPFINEGIKNLHRKTLRNMVIFFICFFSIYDVIRILKHLEEFHSLRSGYSPLWLSILYIIGAYFGKYVFNYEKQESITYFIKWMLIYLFLTLFNWKLHLILLYKKKKDFRLSLFKRYPYPIVLFQAISLLMIFSKLNLNHNIIKKIITFFTPHVFGVLLFHSRILHLKTEIMKNFFFKIGKTNDEYFSYMIIFWAIFFFILCALVDYFRLLIFKLFKIKEICILFEDKSPILIDKILIFFRLEKN